MSSRAEARDLVAKLVEFYPSAAWTMLSDVRNTTGASDAVGYADALAVRVLPAHGPWVLHGFEVKRTRADWLVELRNPQKSAPFRKHCARWYLVVPAPWKQVVLTLGELPEAWGLIEVGGGPPVFVHEPAATEVEEPPIEFVRSMLRAAASIPEREAEAASDIPMQPVSRVLRSRVALGCGHIIPYLGKDKDRPRELPCASCAADLPIDLEIAELAIEDAAPEDLDRLASLIDRVRAVRSVPVEPPAPPVRRARFGRAVRH